MDIDTLTPERIDAFHHRKRPNRLDVVVDVDTARFYLVPREKEHCVFVPQLPRQRASAMIPFWMTLAKDNQVYYLEQLVVGASSFEDVTGTRHSRRDLMRARELAWQLIVNSPDISNARIRRDEVLDVYCLYGIA